MAVRHAGEPLVYQSLESNANAAFTALFALEAAIKLMGLGPRQYVSSRWNCFDAGLVAGSILSAALDVGAAGILLRMFRILRVFRLVKASPTLQHLVRTLMFSLPAFGNIMAILGACQVEFKLYCILLLTLLNRC